MSKFSKRSVLLFYNFAGILPFKIEENELKISKFVSIWIFVATYLSAIAVIVIMLSPYLSSICFASAIIEYQSYSYFAIFLLTLEICNSQGVSVAICSMQLWKRKTMLNLMKEIANLHNTLDESLKECLRKLATKNILIASTVFTIFFVAQLAFLKMSVYVMLVDFMLVYPYIVILGFLGFTKTFEEFLTVLMRDFNNKLRESLERDDFDFEMIQMLMIRYRTIHRLSETFNMIFGLQMSTVTFTVAIMTTLDVIFSTSSTYNYFL